MEKEKVNKSGLLLATEGYVSSIRNYAIESKLEFTEDETRRIMSAIRVVDELLRNNGLVWADLDRNNAENVLQQVAFLKLNPSATPRECYFILRNQKRGDGSWGKKLEMGIEGAGNDAILRSFGLNIKEIKHFIVYEGDEFTPPYYDGWEVVLPKLQPKFKSKKPLYAYYLIKKTTNEIEVAIAEREEVKRPLLAHIRQNGADENKLRELDKYSLDELLTKDEFVNGKIEVEKTKRVNGKLIKYMDENAMIGLAWTSSVSKETMIERKLRNLATRKYPKDYSNPILQRLYEDTFEDEKYDPKTITTEEIVEENELDFQENANVETIKNENDLNVSDDFIVENEEDTIEFDIDTGEVVEEEKEEEPAPNMPDWMI